MLRAAAAARRLASRWLRPFARRHAASARADTPRFELLDAPGPEAARGLVTAPTRLVPRRSMVTTTVVVGAACAAAGLAAGWSIGRLERLERPEPIVESPSLLARYAWTRRDLRRQTSQNELVVRGLAGEHCQRVFATALTDPAEARSRCAEWFDRRVDEFQACVAAELAEPTTRGVTPAAPERARIVHLCSRGIDQVFQPGSQVAGDALVRLTLDWWATRAELDSRAR